MWGQSELRGMIMGRRRGDTSVYTVDIDAKSVMTNRACGRCRRADMGPNAIPLPAFMNPLPFASQGWVLDFAVSTQISWELINFLFWPQARVVQKGNLYKVWKAEVLSEGHWGLMRWQVQRHLAGFSSFSSSSWQSAAQARHFLLDP